MQNKSFQTLYKLIAAGVPLLLLGCISQTAYHSHKILPEQEWHKWDTLTFYIDTLPPSTDRKLTVEVRTNSSFPYQNLSIMVEQEWEKNTEGKQMVTLDTQPSNSIYLSPSASAPIMLPKHAKKGKIKVYHYMKRETLKGINDVGILID